MHLIEQMSSVKLIDSLIDFSIDRYRREKINHNLKNSSKSLTSVYHINELTIGMSKISIQKIDFFFSFMKVIIKILLIITMGFLLNFKKLIQHVQSNVSLVLEKQISGLIYINILINTYIKCIFSSNQIVHKISFSLFFGLQTI